MTHARFVSAVLSSVLIVFFACSAAAQCDPAIGHVTFTSPGAGATVTAPINVLAGATSSCRLTSIQIYLDGILQWTQYRQNILHVSLSAAIGRHTLQVKGWNAAGKSFTSDHVVYVKSVLADKCQSPFNLDNSVWPCKPLEYAVNDSPAWIEAKVRSDTAPLLHTNIVVNGALWAIADGDAASHPAADFMLPPGLYYADIASSNTAGVAMHNPVTFTVRSQVACQAPVVSVMDPTPDNGHPLAARGASSGFPAGRAT
jgi:hypothetical protein